MGKTLAQIRAADPATLDAWEQAWRHYLDAHPDTIASWRFQNGCLPLDVARPDHTAECERLNLADLLCWRDADGVPECVAEE